MEKLSVYIVTLNEEARLAATLEAARQVADEIIVVDSGSTDKTGKIAATYGAKVILHKWISYCDQKNYAQSQCQNDWVLLLDADEVLSPALIREIKALPERPVYNAYKMKIANVYPGDKKPPFFAETFNVVRLYNKTIASMPKDKWNKDRVAVPMGEKIGQLKGLVHHYCLLSIEQAVEKYNRHSTELLKTLIADNRSFSRVRLVTEFPRQFLHYYFKKRMMFAGVKGFNQAMVTAYFRYLKIAKWFEYKARQKTIQK